MHGCSPGFTFLVNAEVDSMGGVVDCGLVLDTKSSPHRSAIAKTQEELRLEYDVREERRRELEFLEKGGNPLDYKYGRATSISVQSTSLRDQHAEHEAKGSFALAASPHGDSVESSGRPTGSLGREPNIADNLLLFTGENSSPITEKITKRTGRRSNAAPAEQSSKIDGCRNSKEPNDLVIFRLGPRGQAYARRNRSRSSRDSHSNKSPLLPASVTDDRDAKELHEELHNEEHTFSAIMNSKSLAPNAKRVHKSFSSKDQLALEIDGSQTNTEKTGLHLVDINTCESLKDGDHNATSVEQAAKSNTVHMPDLIGKDSTASDGFLSVPFCAVDNIKSSNHDERDKTHRATDVDVVNAHENNATGKENVSSTMNEVFDRMNVDINPSSVSTAHFYRSTDGSDSLTFRIGGSSGINSNDQTACQVTSGIVLAIENRPIASAAAYIPSNGETRASMEKFNKSVEVKDEMQLCEPAEDASFSDIELRTTKKPNISQNDEIQALKAGIIIASSTGHNLEPSSEILSQKVCSTAAEFQSSEANQLRLSKRAHEDDVLKEARMIEATLKRAAAPSISCISSENRKKWHWDFVLEEMAWMANDFMQERLWKTTAAAQVCHWIASVGRSKFEQENLCQKQRNVARTLAKSVMSFWSSVGATLIKGEASSGMKEDFDANLFKASNISSLNTMKDQSVENGGRLLKPGVQAYALRLLQYLSDISSDPILTEAPRTPDRIKDTGSSGVFWDDLHSKEKLFYKVLPGAMRSYRESMESQLAHFKVEECEASMCDSVADGHRGIALEEDEGETGADILSGGFESKFSSKFSHKKKKVGLPKSYTTRYEVGTDLTYEPCFEGKSASHSVLIMGKRPSGILNATVVPTKRTRTAARQRIISPFTAGSTGALPVTSKTDVSSGDTTSFQDEQSSRYGCSQAQKNLEVDSTVDFERFLSFDSSDMPLKPKKKKKPKHFCYKNSLNHSDSKVLIVSGNASSYEQRLQADYMVQQDQRDHVKKRCENLQFESNGNTGFYGQNVAKKPKLSKRAESPEPFISASGSMPSPVASQMSNMSNSNRLIKIISNRDRGRKSKALKMAAGQSGYGIAWSTFEDQALVVLVHDMGLNWELVSDALNSTLHFKCIYRKPIECKERHKFLMDKSAGDGADSAEDSGSSQPYQSTLPGIPKGSARQLFQRLQGPMEEDTMKSHFEKIILIGQRLHPCQTQDNKQQLKPIAQVHNSHMFVLSQACPNNLSGPFLSPIDFSDAVNSNTDVVGLGYQGPQANGIVIPGHQGSLAPVLPTSSANSLLQGASNMALGTGLPAPSTPVPMPSRDAQRYGVPRSNTLPIDDQKRVQQYSQNISGRNMQQPGITMTSALPAGADRGVRMLAGGNGMGMMCGVNRSMSMPRTGFQGVSPTGMLNMVSPNSMLSSSVGMPNPMGAHTNVVSGPGNTMLRPRDSLQMMRPGQTTEEHRQIMMQEIQLQVSQGNAQAISPFNGMSAPFSNAPVPPPVQTIPVQQHQTHQIPQQPHNHGNLNNSHIQGNNHSSSQQQAYIRFAKESQLQQRVTPQTQHPYSGSNNMSPLQNNSPFQQQSQSTSPVNSIASSQPQHKQQPMPRNPQTSSLMSSQIMKQRQRQQVQLQQQQSRNQQQSKQQVQQQSKLIKGLGRGTMLMHQNLPVDAAQVGSRPTAPNNQASEKLVVQQSQGFNHGSAGLNSNLQQPSIQQKLYSRPNLPQSKQVSPMPSHSDANQASMQAPSHTLRAAQQSVQATVTATQQQQQQQQRQSNQSTTNMQRLILSQNRHLNHDSRMQSINETVPVNQITPSPSLPKTTDSSSLSASVSSGVHWKPEPSFETCTTGEKAQLAALPQENFTGNDAIIPSSTHGLVQRQLSGNISIHGHGVGGQWQQQIQPTPLPQQHHRQGVQGNLCSRPSNAGS